jgi:small GTP-binding protein
LPKRKGSKKSGREFKIAIIGDGAVGKTSLIHRFCDESFQKTYLATIGVDITTKAIDLNNNTFTFVFWDIAGQEKFKAHRQVFYKGTEGVIMVCDATNLASVESLIRWNQELTAVCDYKFPRIFLINKIDLFRERKVFPEQIDKVKKVLDLPADVLFETSALDGKNVDAAFYKLGELLIEVYIK